MINIKINSFLIRHLDAIYKDIKEYADKMPLTEEEKSRFQFKPYTYRIRKNRPLSFIIEDVEDIDIEDLLETISWCYDTMIFWKERGPDYTLIHYYGKMA